MASLVHATTFSHLDLAGASPLSLPALNQSERFCSIPSHKLAPLHDPDPCYASCSGLLPSPRSSLISQSLCPCSPSEGTLFLRYRPELLHLSHVFAQMLPRWVTCLPILLKWPPHLALSSSCFSPVLSTTWQMCPSSGFQQLPAQLDHQLLRAEAPGCLVPTAPVSRTGLGKQ